MAPIFKPVEYYTSKLYEKGNASKRFMDLTEDDLKELKKKVEEKRKMMSDNVTFRSVHMPKFDVYQSALEYLTNPTIHLKYRTFDERVAFLIMMVDTELVLRDLLIEDLSLRNEINFGKNNQAIIELKVK